MRMVEVLPAPLGPRNPNASPRAHVDVDAVDRGEVAEALHQPAGVDQGFVASRADPSGGVRQPADSNAGRPTVGRSVSPRRPARRSPSTTGVGVDRRARVVADRPARPSTPGHPPADDPHAAAGQRVVRGVRHRAGHPGPHLVRHVARLEQQVRHHRPRRPSRCSRRARSATSAGVIRSSRPDQVALWISCQPSRVGRVRAATARGWWRPPPRRRRVRAQASTRSSRLERRARAPPAACGARNSEHASQPSRRLLAQRPRVLLQREELAGERQVLVLAASPG